MTRHPGASPWPNNAVLRAEENDPELRQRRIALDEASLQLKLCAADMKSLAFNDYRMALHNLLHYLSTTYLT